MSSSQQTLHQNLTSHSLFAFSNTNIQARNLGRSVLINSSKPHSSLKNKSSSIAFHFVREEVAKDEWRVSYLNTKLNCADMAIKSLPGGEKRTLFTSYLLHYVYDTNVISFYLLHMTSVISIDGLDDDVRCRTISFDHLK